MARRNHIKKGLSFFGELHKKACSIGDKSMLAVYPYKSDARGNLFINLHFLD